MLVPLFLILYIFFIILLCFGSNMYSSRKPLAYNKKLLLLKWVILMASFNRLGGSKCEFEAIFNFGDSNSDTGGFWAAFPAQSGPFGMTYFKRPSGRACDGRLILDFLGK